MELQDLSSSLRSAISALNKRLRKQMYTAETLSITEIETIGLLYRRESLLPSQLAALVKVKTPTMSQILRKMESAEAIKRTPSPEDGRKVVVSITPLGRQLVRQSRYERDEWLANAIEASLTDKEKKLLAEAIKIVNKLAEAQ